ncbi:uncharacterized protein C16orf86 homolog isoform X1 [Chlorocebus sabaeus]|uniref:Chromosome 16 open reading frame 86 n=1 Tax=Chlorocebus sabaeus TaxID=60711 RepID=A0A0D9QVB6_CHLSB|nr:uncharacterized protein C16orf86 homolog isoform X1 [Chlorocebus sabaeus]XP_037863955.1 uncharacterized protein C16orf86 homolog isoform X1 [Chlorocebus sabaeus]
MVQRESLSSEGALGKEEGKELQARGWGTHPSSIPDSCTPAGRILVLCHYHHSPLPFFKSPRVGSSRRVGASGFVGHWAHWPLSLLGLGPHRPGKGQASSPGAVGRLGYSLCQVSCPWLRSLSLPGLRAHPKAEAELPPRLPLQEEEPEGSQSEPSPSAKQHKKAKKRKSLGAPVLHAVASTVSAPLETLGLERKAQRLRPLYQYINYCNPELNQAGEGDGEAEVEAEAELALVPEEAGVEQLQALLPLAGELGPGLALPCPSALVTPIHALAPLGEEAGEEAGGLPSLGVSDHHKAEVDKSTQVDIDKMLSVCTAPLVPPLSPQYK